MLARSSRHSACTDIDTHRYVGKYGTAEASEFASPEKKFAITTGFSTHTHTPEATAGKSCMFSIGPLTCIYQHRQETCVVSRFSNRCASVLPERLHSPIIPSRTYME